MRESLISYLINWFTLLFNQSQIDYLGEMYENDCLGFNCHRKD